jgi:hypothetical protein
VNVHRFAQLLHTSARAGTLGDRPPFPFFPRAYYYWFEKKDPEEAVRRWTREVPV